MKPFYKLLFRPLTIILLSIFLYKVFDLSQLFTFIPKGNVSINLSIYTILSTSIVSLIEYEVSKRIPVITAYINTDKNDLTKQDESITVSRESPKQVYACITCENWNNTSKNYLEFFVDFPDFLDGSCGNNVVDDKTRKLLICRMDNHKAIVPFSIMANDINGNKDDFISIDIKKNKKNRMKIFHKNHLKIRA
ncbi:conserved protein of unknown function [Latilactobacillus sakei]|nr:conserved protein of unknown function [Latilactobacillus sakei]